MSEFPSDWSRTTFGNVLNQRKESGFTNEELLAVTSSLGIVKRDTLERRDTSNEDKSKYLLVNEGDIAYNTMRMWQGVSGVSRFRGIVSPAYTICTPTERLDAGFAGYLLKDPEMVSVFRQRSQGLVSDTWNLKYESFAQIPCVIPPLPEQKKIDEILSGIDHFIEKAKKEVMKYESLKQATLYEYPLKYSSGQVLLHECANLQAGGTPDRGKSSFWDGNIPWVKTGEVNYNLITSTEECISEEGLQSSSARLLPKGSILMAMYGQGVTRGRVAKLGISAATNQACLAINSRTPEVGNDYLYWILASKYEHLRSQVQEGTQKNLSKGIVGDQIIPLLEGRRQEEFCKLCSNFDALIKLKRSEASALSKLKNSISSDLLSGRKRVSI
jgi:type I restriction enzyme, S subunit